MGKHQEERKIPVIMVKKRRTFSGAAKTLCSGLYHGKRSPADDPTARPG